MNAYHLGFTSTLGAEVEVIAYATSSEQAERKVRNALGNELVNSRLSWWEIVTAAPRASIRIFR